MVAIIQGKFICMDCKYVLKITDSFTKNCPSCSEDLKWCYQCKNCNTTKCIKCDEFLNKSQYEAK